MARRLLRSDMYWRVVGATSGTAGGGAGPSAAEPEQETVVQDVEVPVGRLPEFLDFFHREVLGISPVWVCPLRQREAQQEWELYVLDPATTYANVGFWSSAPLPEGAEEGHHNRRIEQVVADLGGRKSLYSTSYYSEDEFWATYGGATYGVRRSPTTPRGGCSTCTRRRFGGGSGAAGGGPAGGARRVERSRVPGLRRIGGRAGRPCRGRRDPLPDGVALRRRLSGRPRAGAGLRHRHPRGPRRPLRDAGRARQGARRKPAARPEAGRLQGRGGTGGAAPPAAPTGGADRRAGSAGPTALQGP